MDTLTGGGVELHTYASWDHPGMAVVTKESTDTQGERDVCRHPGSIPGWP